eukprot:168855_1
MSLLQKLQDKLLPYIEDEKENYNRSLKYLKRCSTVAILSLSLLIILFLYVKLYHRPTHPLHTSTIHETTFKRTFKSNPTSPIYHTAHDINPHLLCSLPTDQSGHHIRNKTYASFLSNLLRLQFPSNCFDEQNKYLIVHHQCNVGFYSSIQCLSYYFLMSIFMDRTFIVTGDWNLAADKTCTKYENNMECYFLPISNCSAQDILDAEYRKPHPSVFTMTHDAIKLRENKTGLRIHKQWFYMSPNAKKPGLNERILVIPPKEISGFGWRYFRKSSMLKSIEFWLNDVYRMDRYDYSALITAYLLRMKQHFKTIVYRATHQKLPNLEKFRKNESVSMLVNWGRGCEGKKSYYYTNCFEYDMYMNVLKQLKLRKPNVKYLIVTSESMEMIDDIRKKYDKWMKQNGIKFVGVEGDLSNYVQGALVTMQLQFASEYHIMSRLEYWEVEFYKMLERLNCTLFNKINDMDYVRLMGKNTAIYLDSNDHVNQSHFHYATWNERMIWDDEPKSESVDSTRWPNEDRH